MHRRGAVALLLAYSTTIMGGGCGAGVNDEVSASTRGVAAADAPKSQADFYKQQKQLLPKSASKTKGSRSRTR